MTNLKQEPGLEHQQVRTPGQHCQTGMPPAAAATAGAALTSLTSQHVGSLMTRDRAGVSGDWMTQQHDVFMTQPYGR